MKASVWMIKMKIFQVSSNPWLSEKANTIPLWRKAFRIYKVEKNNNSKLIIEDHKTQNEMNHHELELAGINNNKSPTNLAP